MGDIIAELTEEANELLDITTANWNALLAFSQDAVLPQHLLAVRERVINHAGIFQDLSQPAPPEVAAVDPAAAQDQQQALSSVSDGPPSSGSSSEA